MPIDVKAYAEEGAELRRRFLLDHEDRIRGIAARIEESFRSGGKLLIFGNGGSAADAQHMAAEMVNRFQRDRAPLPAMALTVDSSVLTSIANDFSFEEVFARQIRALGRPGDVALAISTSGDSPNVVVGIEAAREAGMATIGLSGNGGGRMKGMCDLELIVPHRRTPLIQEVHLAAEHLICDLMDASFSDKP